MRSQFTKIKIEQARAQTISNKGGTIVDQLSSLHESASLEFYLQVIRDYKHLFLSPQRVKAQPRESLPHRTSTISKPLLHFKSDQEEKQELREFRKFVQMLTSSYFNEVNSILSGVQHSSEQDNSILKGFIGMFSYNC